MIAGERESSKTNGRRSILASVLSPFKEFGWFAGLCYAIDRIFQRLSPNLRLYFYELLAQPIPEEPLIPAQLSRTFEMREIKRGDPEVARMPARADIKESRFRQNALCLGTYQKGRLIGYMWFCFNLYEEDEVRCNFVLPENNQAVFDFDFYIFPEYRMGLSFIGIWNGANQLLRSRGLQCSFSRLTRYNLPSRRAHLRLGALRIGRVFVLQAWGTELLLASVAPYLHLSLTKSNRARVRLSAPQGLIESPLRRLVDVEAG